MTTPPGPARPAPEAASVLIVDDMATVRLMLSHQVRQLGHHVTLAVDGREALARLAARPFDLVLLDIEMPQMDGIAVLERIKADRTLREIPVVMISGVDELDSVVRCIECGAEDYLPKPFNPTLLKARIGASLEKKRLWDELSQQYRQLQELESHRDSLAHMIVHDLRTPLTSIISGLQTVQGLDDSDAALRRELLDMALGGGETLLGMINDLLDISRMESGLPGLELTEARADALIAQALQQVTPLAEEKGLRVVREIEPDLPPFPADSNKVRRTLVNLLGNAVKFSPPRKALTIRALRHEDAAQEAAILFSVADEGEGIPEEAFGRIFEKFGQVENRTAGRRMSTGLGLTFCKMVVEAHGGRIWVSSTLGQGSVFFCTFPLSPPAAHKRS